MRCPACHSHAIAQAAPNQLQYICTDCQKIFQRRPHWGRLLAGAIGMTALLAASPLIASRTTNTLLSLLPVDDGAPVDAIVVLGRGIYHQQSRTLAAAQLWSEGRSPQIFISGNGDASEIIDRLADMNIPLSVLSGEHCSKTTWGNGVFSWAMLEPQSVERILLVTDRPHMVRSHLVFEGFGFEVVPYPVEVDPGPGWRNQPYLLKIRELTALAKYGITGKLWPQPNRVRQKAEAMGPERLEDWGCHLDGDESF